MDTRKWKTSSDSPQAGGGVQSSRKNHEWLKDCKSSPLFSDDFTSNTFLFGCASSAFNATSLVEILQPACLTHLKWNVCEMWLGGVRKHFKRWSHQPSTTHLVRNWKKNYANTTSCRSSSAVKSICPQKYILTQRRGAGSPKRPTHYRNEQLGPRRGERPFCDGLSYLWV